MILAYLAYFIVNSSIATSCPYVLPYKTNTRHRVLQSFNGKYSHLPPLQYGVDFEMSKGTEIFAARSGIIIETKSNSNLSGKTREFIKHANFIKILHSDKSQALYAHLQFNGIFVKKGQKVKASERIGLSGCTGFCDGAHLHFEVYRPSQNKKGRVSLPFKFLTQSGILKSLQRQKSYTSIMPSKICP